MSCEHTECIHHVVCENKNYNIVFCTYYERRQKMRLIDADKLKEQIDYFMCYEGSSIYDIIDNAPTVPLPDFKEGYKQAIRDGKTNFSRPQGEWIDGYCSVCGASGLCDGWGIDVESSFCPRCGAKMKGEEE